MKKVALLDKAIEDGLEVSSAPMKKIMAVVTGAIDVVPGQLTTGGGRPLRTSRRPPKLLGEEEETPRKNPAHETDAAPGRPTHISNPNSPVTPQH